MVFVSKGGVLNDDSVCMCVCVVWAGTCGSKALNL